MQWLTFQAICARLGSDLFKPSANQELVFLLNNRLHNAERAGVPRESNTLSCIMSLLSKVQDNRNPKVPAPRGNNTSTRGGAVSLPYFLGMFLYLITLF